GELLGMMEPDSGQSRTARLLGRIGPQASSADAALTGLLNHQHPNVRASPSSRALQRLCQNPWSPAPRSACLSFAKRRSTDGLNRLPRCASSRSIAGGLDYLLKARQSGSCLWSHLTEETGGVLRVNVAVPPQEFRRHRCNFLCVFGREPPERLRGRHPG